jgi:hypothetical protein
VSETYVRGGRAREKENREGRSFQRKPQPSLVRKKVLSCEAESLSCEVLSCEVLSCEVTKKVLSCEAGNLLCEVGRSCESTTREVD